MFNKALILIVLAVSGNAFAGEADKCAIFVKANTRKVTRELKEILVAKKYHIVDTLAESTRQVYADRGSCSMPIGCGRSWYAILFYAPTAMDPRPGMTYLEADFRDVKRKRAIADFEARLGNCPDAI